MASDEQLNNQRSLNEEFEAYSRNIVEATEFVGLLTSRTSELADAYKKVAKDSGTYGENEKSTLGVLTNIAKQARSLETPYTNLKSASKDLEKSLKNRQQLTNSLSAAQSKLSSSEKDAIKQVQKLREDIKQKQQKEAEAASKLSEGEIQAVDALIDKELERKDAQETLNNLIASGANQDEIDKAQQKLNLAEQEVSVAESGLSTAQKDYRLKRDAVASGRDSLESAEAQLSAEAKKVLALKEAEEANENIIKYQEEQIEKLNNVEKAQALANVTFGAAAKILDSIGLGSVADTIGLSSAMEAASEKAKEVTKNGEQAAGVIGKMKILAAGVGAALKTALGPLALLAGIAKAFRSGEQAIDRASTAAVSFSKELGVGVDVGKQMYSTSQDIASEIDAFAENVLANTAALQKQLGTTKQLGKETLTTFNQLVEKGGYSVESAATFTKMSDLTGKSLKDNTAEMIGQIEAMKAQEGVALDTKATMEAIGSTSKATRLTLGNSAKELAKAAFESKKLGLEIDAVNNAGSSLLDFEQSIAKEMEAELLLGRDINLERARSAALQGDTATVASEISKQIGSAAEFTKMNVIQQQALADAVGLSREELAGALEQQELLAGTNFDDMNQAQERFNELVEQGLSIEEAKKEIGNAALADQLAATTYAEELELRQRSIQDAFAAVAEALMPLVNTFRDLAVRLAPMLAKVITTLTTVLEPVLDVIMEIANGFGDMVGEVTNDLVPIIKTIGEALTPILKIITTIIGEVAGGLMGAFTVIVDIIKNITVALQPVFQSLGELAKSILPIISNIFEKLKGPINTIANVLSEVLVTVADALVPVFESVFSVISSLIEPLSKILDAILEPIVGILGVVADLFKGPILGAIEKIIGALTTVVDALIKPLETILGVVVNLINQLIDPVTVLLNMFGEIVATVADALVPVIEVVANLITKLVEPLSTVLTSLLEPIGAIFEKIADVVGRIANLVADYLVVYFEMLIGIVMSLVEALMPIVDTVLKVMVDTLLPAISGLLEEVIGAAVELFEALYPVIEQVFDVIVKELLPVVLDLFNALVPVVLQLVEALLPIVESVFEVVADLLPIVARLIQSIVPVAVKIVEALMPLVTAILDVVVSLLPVITQLLDAILPVVIPIVEAFAELVEMILPMLIPVIELFAGIVESLLPLLDPFIVAIETVLVPLISAVAALFRGDFGAAFDFIVEAFYGIIDTISSAFSAIGEVISGIFKSIGNFFINMVNGVIGGLNSISATIPDWVPLVGGRTFGLNIPEIPALATGGIVDEPTLALIGEAGPEAVIPLDQLPSYAGPVGEGGSSGGGISSTVIAKIGNALTKGFTSLSSSLQKIGGALKQGFSAFLPALINISKAINNISIKFTVEPITISLDDYITRPSNINLNNYIIYPELIDLNNYIIYPELIDLNNYIIYPELIDLNNYVIPPSLIVMDDYVMLPNIININDFIVKPDIIDINSYIEIQNILLNAYIKVSNIDITPYIKVNDINLNEYITKAIDLNDYIEENIDLTGKLAEIDFTEVLKLNAQETASLRSQLAEAEAQLGNRSLLEKGASAIAGGFRKVQLFAKGGVVTKPTQGIVGEEGPEAIIPLQQLPTIINESNNDDLRQEFNEMKELLKEVIDRPVVVNSTIELDGNKVGQALGQNSYRIQ